MTKEKTDIQIQYEQLSHPYCGTSKCCGQCDTATTAIVINENMDEEFEEHCKKFFKGGTSETDSEGGEI